MKEIISHLRHPRKAYQELNTKLNKMVLQIGSSGSACEPGMKLPMIEINPEIEKSETKEVVE